MHATRREATLASLQLKLDHCTRKTLNPYDNSAAHIPTLMVLFAEMNPVIANWISCWPLHILMKFILFAQEIQLVASIYGLLVDRNGRTCSSPNLSACSILNYPKLFWYLKQIPKTKSYVNTHVQDLTDETKLRLWWTHTSPYVHVNIHTCGHLVVCRHESSHTYRKVGEVHNGIPLFTIISKPN